MTPSSSTAVTAALVVHLLGSPWTGTPFSAQDFPYPAFDDVSIRGFIQEVLYGTGSGRTPLFHDSSASYHVQPRALLERLPVEAAIHGLHLSAAVVLGPYGGLWAYEVFAFLEEASCIRVNRVVMPHARITYKGTACLPKPEVAEWLLRFRERVTSAAGTYSPDCSPCVVSADYTAPKPTLAHAPFRCNDGSHSTAIVDELRQEIVLRLVTTYHTYPPVPLPR